MLLPWKWLSTIPHVSGLDGGSRGRLSGLLRYLQEARQLELQKLQIMGLIRKLNAMYSSGVPQRA